MRIFPAIILCLSLSGCGLELLGATAIQSGLRKDSMVAAKQTLDHAKNSTARISAEQAINVYRAETGENPESLEALVPEWLPAVPVKADGTLFGYDPSTGALLDSPLEMVAEEALYQTPGIMDTKYPKETNNEKQMRIHNAILKYIQEERKYPPSLAALTPGYLSEPLLTNDGQHFDYDPSLAMVTIPDPLPPNLQQPMTSNVPISQPQRRTNRAPVGAGGPLGEVMTGIAIQNELNRSYGQSPASGAVRQKARESGNQHNRKQEQIMDDLGL